MLADHCCREVVPMQELKQKVRHAILFRMRLSPTFGVVHDPHESGQAQASLQRLGYKPLASHHRQVLSHSIYMRKRKESPPELDVADLDMRLQSLYWSHYRPCC